MNSHFYDVVMNVVEEVEMNPNLLCLEMTETVLIKSLKKGEVLINRFRDKGIEIALDDFGTGYSSLKYFNELNIDTVKIDKSFVDKTVRDNYSIFFIKSIVDLACYKGINLISEGIETQEQLDVLRSYGCDIIQGYYFARPLSEEDAIMYLEQFNQMKEVPTS